MPVRTNNITRALKKAADKFDLDCERARREKDIVTYVYNNRRLINNKKVYLEQPVDVSIYDPRFAKQLAEKMHYEIQKELKKTKVNLTLEQIIYHVIKVEEEAFEKYCDGDTASYNIILGKIIQLTNGKVPLEEIHKIIEGVKNEN